MKKEDFFELLGEVDETKIQEAGMMLEPQIIKRNPKRFIWFKWGSVAACLFLIAGGTLLIKIFPSKLPFTSPEEILEEKIPDAPNTPDKGNSADNDNVDNILQQNTPVSGGGTQNNEETTGGSFPDGVDPVVASLAVYPSEESIQDVETATVTNLNESEAYQVPEIGAYLPVHLPDGYHFQKANLYETTMKNGTQYHMLRVSFANYEEIPPVYDEEGGEVAVSESLGESFLLFVMDYLPNSESVNQHTYSADKLPENIVEEMNGSTFYVSYSDALVGLETFDLNSEEVLDMLHSIGQPESMK